MSVLILGVGRWPKNGGERLPGPSLGTVVQAPRTSRGHNYVVAFGGGYWLNGKDCPQYVNEEKLAPAPQDTAARARNTI